MIRSPVLAIALNSWKENVRSRFFVLSIAFGGVILYLSLLLGLLASDQEMRVLVDCGLALIELMALLGAVYGAATGILKEMETKTIYLVLTRPVSRTEYLLGRFLGLMLSVLASMLLMCVFHLAILFAKGWTWDFYYPKAVLGAYLKVLITTALTTFLALFSTSVLLALTITAILWTLGHVLPEIRFLIAHQSRHGSAQPLMLLSYLLPNLQLFNFRDKIDVVSAAPPAASMRVWFLYAFVYAGAWLALARSLLKKKEF